MGHALGLGHAASLESNSLFNGAPWGPNDHVEYGNTISAMGGKGTGVWQRRRGIHFAAERMYMPNELVELRWANPSMVEFIKKSKREYKIQTFEAHTADGPAVLVWHDVKTNEYHWYSFHNHRDTFSNANGMGFAHVITRDFGKWDKDLNLKTSLLVRIHNTRTFTSANGLHFQITSLTPGRATVTIHFSVKHVHFPVAKVFTSEKEVIITFPPPTVKNNYLPFYIMQRDITIECP